VQRDVLEKATLVPKRGLPRAHGALYSMAAARSFSPVTPVCLLVRRNFAA
jgi:hypothetical protein